MPWVVWYESHGCPVVYQSVKLQRPQWQGGAALASSNWLLFGSLAAEKSLLAVTRGVRIIQGLDGLKRLDVNSRQAVFSGAFDQEAFVPCIGPERWIGFWPRSDVDPSLRSGSRYCPYDLALACAARALATIQDEQVLVRDGVQDTLRCGRATIVGSEVPARHTSLDVTIPSEMRGYLIT